MPMNLVVIMKDGGRDVWRLSQLVIFCCFCARFRRMVLSMSAQINKAGTRTSPSASMRRGDLSGENKLVPMFPPLLPNAKL